jgi:hypothetical protein
MSRNTVGPKYNVLTKNCAVLVFRKNNKNKSEVHDKIGRRISL